MSRTLAREDALRIVFTSCTPGEAEVALKQYFDEVTSEKDGKWCLKELDDADREYVENVVMGVAEHLGEIDAAIGENLKPTWSVARLAKAEKAVLRVAVHDMKFRGDVPESIAINEAVELAKKYGGGAAGAFVNGVLGAMVKKDG